MNIREEFLQILGILAETPEPTARKPPSPESDQTSEATSDVSRRRSGNDKCRGTGS